jgi:hypothetical protein
MQVTTVLGPLLVSDPPVGTADIWAQGVSLCARDMTVYVGKVPDALRPAARVLARSWCDDTRYADAVRSIETNDLSSLVRWQATLPDVSEATAQGLAKVHALVGDQARGSTGRLLTLAQLLQQGRLDEARKRVAAGYAKTSGNGAPLASVGALRAHTGAALTAAAFDRPDGSVIEIP